MAGRGGGRVGTAEDGFRAVSRKLGVGVGRAGRPAPRDLHAKLDETFHVGLRNVLGLDAPVGAAVVVIAQRDAQRPATHPVQTGRASPRRCRRSSGSVGTGRRTPWPWRTSSAVTPGSNIEVLSPTRTMGPSPIRAGGRSALVSREMTVTALVRQPAVARHLDGSREADLLAAGEKSVTFPQACRSSGERFQGGDDHRAADQVVAGARMDAAVAHLAVGQVPHRKIPEEAAPAPCWPPDSPPARRRGSATVPVPPVRAAPSRGDPCARKKRSAPRSGTPPPHPDNGRSGCRNRPRAGSPPAGPRSRPSDGLRARAPRERGPSARAKSFARWPTAFPCPRSGLRSGCPLR